MQRGSHLWRQQVGSAGWNRQPFAQPRGPVRRLAENGVEKPQHLYDIAGLFQVAPGAAADDRQSEQHPQRFRNVQACLRATPLAPSAAIDGELMPERDQRRRQGVPLHDRADGTAAIQPEMPEILAVTVGMEAVVGVVEQHRFGVTVESVLGFGHLAEGGGEFDQQPPATRVGGADASQIPLQLFPNAGFGPLALVPLIHKHQIAAILKDLGGDRDPIALFLGGQLVDVQHDHRIRRQMAQDGSIAVQRIGEHRPLAQAAKLLGVLAGERLGRGDQQDAIPVLAGLQQGQRGVQDMGFAGGRGHPERRELQIGLGERLQYDARRRVSGEPLVEPGQQGGRVAEPGVQPVGEQQQGQILGVTGRQSHLQAGGS